MDGRHDGNTEINVAALIANAESPVLWNTTFCDIQLGHHLDTRDQSLMESEIDRIDFGVERSVNSILYLDLSVTSFDVNIGSSRFHRVINNRVDEFDDRRHLRICCQPIQIQNFFAMFCFSDKRNAK